MNKLNGEAKNAFRNCSTTLAAARKKLGQDHPDLQGFRGVLNSILEGGHDDKVIISLCQELTNEILSVCTKNLNNPSSTDDDGSPDCPERFLSPKKKPEQER